MKNFLPLFYVLHFTLWMCEHFCESGCNVELHGCIGMFAPKIKEVNGLMIFDAVSDHTLNVT